MTYTYRQTLSGVRYGSGGVVPSQWGRLGSLATGSLGSLGEDEDEDEEEEQSQNVASTTGSSSSFDIPEPVKYLSGGYAVKKFYDGVTGTWKKAVDESPWYKDWKFGDPLPVIPEPSSNVPPTVDQFGDACLIENGEGLIDQQGRCFVVTCNTGFAANNDRSKCEPKVEKKDEQSKPKSGGGGAVGPKRTGGAAPPAGGPAAAPGKAKKSLLKNPLVWVGAIVAIGGVGLVTFKGKKR